MNSHNQQKAILGTLIIEPLLFSRIATYIERPEMFSPDLQGVASFIIGRCSEGKTFDLAMIRDLTDAKVVDELIHHQAENEDALIAYAMNFVKSWQSTETIRVMDRARSALASGAEYDETMAQLSVEMEMIEALDVATDNRTDIIRKALERVEKAMRCEGISGVPSGLNTLDEFTGGFQPGNLIVVGARTGMGKTTFLCQCALGAARAGHPTAFFSFGDMTKEELTLKFISMVTGIHYKRIMLGRLTADEYRRMLDAADEVRDLPIHLFDTTDMPPKVAVMRDKVRRLKEQHGVTFLVSDYVQQMRSHDDRLSETENISHVTRICKETAAMLNIPHLTASQLNRAVETRGGSKRPQLSDLRQSGTIEQDANQIFFLYRPDYYGITEDEEGRSVIGMTELIAAKDRAGGTGETLMLSWRNERFADLEEVSPQFPATVSNHIPAQSVPDEDLPF